MKTLALVSRSIVYKLVPKLFWFFEVSIRNVKIPCLLVPHHSYSKRFLCTSPSFRHPRSIRLSWPGSTSHSPKRRDKTTPDTPLASKTKSFIFLKTSKKGTTRRTKTKKNIQPQKPFMKSKALINGTTFPAIHFVKTTRTLRAAPPFIWKSVSPTAHAASWNPWVERKEVAPGWVFQSGLDPFDLESTGLGLFWRKPTNGFHMLSCSDPDSWLKQTSASGVSHIQGARRQWSIDLNGRSITCLYELQGFIYILCKHGCHA